MSTVEKTYEMMWDCEYCGTKKLLGLTQRFCPQCGGPQNPQKRYFPPDEERVAVQDHKFVGADVTCPSCKHAMSRACNNCSNCGGPIGDGKQVAMQQGMTQAQGGQWQATPAAGAPAKSSSRWIVIAAVAAVGLIGTCVALRTMKRQAKMIVSRHEWTREIAIERYDEVEEHGACSNVPSDGRVKSRSTPAPVCTKKKVDNGDGTFKEKEECTEPVEQCTYAIDKWHQVRTAKATGGPDKDPAWPDTDVSACASRGCEREGSRSEKYTVYFNEDGGDKKEGLTCDFKDTAAWNSYPDGAKYKGKVHSFGGDLDCDTLERQ